MNLQKEFVYIMFHVLNINKIKKIDNFLIHFCEFTFFSGFQLVYF